MSAGEPPSTGSVDLTNLPLRGGLVNGAGAYVAGLLFSTAAFALLGQTFVGTFAPTPTEVFGWVYYGGHFVPVTLDGSQINYASDVASNSVVYYALPVVLLVSSGYYVANGVDLGESTLQAAAAGATITVGYLPLVVLGVFLFQHEGLDTSVTVPFVRTVLLAGLFYPVVAGGLGGLLTTR